MNFYKHHIGDYSSATEHLNWDEDMAYSRLIRAYYRDERPIPLDFEKACRLVRAQSKPQRKAVEEVLREFFTQQEDGWHNKRCDIEIAAASNQADTNRRIAEEREQAKRARNVNGSSHESSTKRSTNRSPAPNESVNLSRLQTPDSTSQTPDSTHTPQPLASEGPCVGDADAGTPRQNGTNPRATGTNPRAQGTNPKAKGANPRALGTNPRAQKQQESGWVPPNWDDDEEVNPNASR